MDKRFYLLLGLILILGIFCGMYIQSQQAIVPEDQFSQMVSADSEHLLEVGETDNVHHFDITVHEAYTTKEEDQLYVVVDVSFFNRSDQSKEIPLFNTLVVNEKGYASENESNYDDQRLIGGQLRPEGLRRGTLAFPVEPSSHYEFTYTNHSGVGLATWDLNVDVNDNE
ncbi:DUF4352 domain-containing protein [Alteribacillus iranensis]|uniref:DUF4352 domain-containing protein n=1 Tax=Alteribacillus iranensis TaxID=930128 RepID=A0A1I1ZZD8_9BACI|nr:DUF4352 domain-containing protein [Alteribacillus iranensis]SFE36979.1 protein of unknown function [Alteribacillus iranensis]